MLLFVPLDKGLIEAQIKVALIIIKQGRYIFGPLVGSRNVFSIFLSVLEAE